jgi:hypothetical protein
MTATMCIGPRRAWTGPLATPVLTRCPLVVLPVTLRRARIVVRTGSRAV